MRQRVLVIGHDHVAGLGHLGPALRRRGYVTEQVTVVPRSRSRTPDVELVLPDVREFDAVVALGAPWPRRAIASWWPAERDALRAAHDAGVGVLGVCFGAQLLGEALGGATEPLGEERVGWVDVDAVHPLLPGGPWFQWHRERIVAPEGAIELARSVDGCEAFGVGRSIGIQFHPEMSSELLRTWDRAWPGEPDRARALGIETERHERSGLADRVDHLAELIVSRWRSA